MFLKDSLVVVKELLELLIFYGLIMVFLCVLVVKEICSQLVLLKVILSEG